MLADADGHLRQKLQQVSAGHYGSRDCSSCLLDLQAKPMSLSERVKPYSLVDDKTCVPAIFDCF